jgi:hypothetical protein
MAQKFLTNIDLNQNQLVNASFEVVGTDPSSGNFEGRLIYQSTTDTIKVYANGAWRSLPHTIVSGGGAGIAEALTVSESNGTITLTLAVADTDSAGLLPAAMWQMLTDATSDATASKLVKRDASGNAKVATPTDSEANISSAAPPLKSNNASSKSWAALSEVRISLKNSDLPDPVGPTTIKCGPSLTKSKLNSAVAVAPIQLRKPFASAATE